MEKTYQPKCLSRKNVSVIVTPFPLPAECFNAVAFYKEKRLRMGGNGDDVIPAVKISPAEGPFFSLLILLRV